MEETKKKLYVERDGFCTEASMLFMILAMLFRLIGSIGRWGDLQYLITQVALPVFSGLLFVLLLMTAGKKAFWTTMVPVVLGVTFFIFRIMSVEGELQKVLCIVLYVVIVVLYAMCFSQHKIKWVLALVLTLAFLYHVGIEDVPLLLNKKQTVLFVEGMQEMSVLAIILSLLFVSLAMRSAPKPVKKPKEKRGGRKDKDAPTPEPVPAETPAEEPVPTLTPTEEPIPEPVEEPVPAPAEEPAEEPQPFSGVPIQELSPGAEPAAAYPVEEPADEAVLSGETDAAETP